MKKKILLYLSLVPLIFSLVLSVFPLSSAFADDYNDVDTDYSLLFLDEYDISSLSSYYNKDTLRTKLGFNYTAYPYYFYNIKFFNTSPNGNNCLELDCEFYFFNSSNIVYEDNDIICFNLARYTTFYLAVRANNLSAYNSQGKLDYSNGPRPVFVYNKKNGRCCYADSYNSDYGSYYWESAYIFYQESNLADFPYATDYHPLTGLNVSVSFSPSLSGDVSRVVGSGSNISYLQNLSMTVSNNSRDSVQYKFYIMKTDQSSHRPWSASGGDMSSALSSHQVVYDDDPVFIYYSNEWVYSANLDNSSDWYNGHPQKQQKSTEWHYISSGSSKTIDFKFSQINLQEGVSYTAIVEAISTDYDCASRLWVSAATSEAVYPEYKQLSIDDKVTVYSSSFNMLQYSDVKYDHNDDSNGINPYSDYSDLESYNWSYLAKEENGVTDYTNKNLYTDQNSWYRQSYNTSNINIPSNSASFNSSTTYISSFLSFVSSVLGFFPAPFLSVFTVGITSVVVIGLIKVVFR